MGDHDVQFLLGKGETWSALKIVILPVSSCILFWVFNVISGAIKNLIQTHRHIVKRITVKNVRNWVPLRIMIQLCVSYHLQFQLYYSFCFLRLVCFYLQQIFVGHLLCTWSYPKGLSHTGVQNTEKIVFFLRHYVICSEWRWVGPDNFASSDIPSFFYSASVTVGYKLCY